MIEIIDKSKYRVALSGTPLPNGYKDLYAMFSLLYGEYAQIYFNMYIDNLSKADVDFENSGLESQEINQKIQPFFTRVSKHDLNVPLSNPDHLVEIETNEMENKLYIQLLNSSNSSFGKSIKLTQLACLSESIDLLNEPSDYDINSFISSNETNFIKQINDVNFSFGNSSKINKLVDLIISLNRKVVVWCVFVDTINKITTILNKKGIATINIYGVTNYNERSNIINDFNNNKSIKVLVTNPHTLAESVSLHKACHDAVYVELNYNLSHYLQSRDRIHRLGLKPNQQTNYFILINNYMGDKNKSIDYLIYKRLIKKEKRMMKAIDGGALLYRDKVGNYEFDELVNEIKTNIKI
jgi:SNF2 family DNA or RNA helicase